MKSIPTAQIVLDTRRKKKNGLYPIRLRVIFERKVKYYSTGKDSSKSDFDRIYGAKPREEFKSLRLYLQHMEERAISAIASVMPYFSFQKFETEYYKDAFVPSSDDVTAAFDSMIGGHLNEGRIGNAESMRNSRDSLLRFKKALKFSDITPEFLRAYERWMLEQKRSLTTVGIYLRALRTLFNDSMHKGLIKETAYPFGKKPLYQIPTGQNIKKALSRTELQKIIEYKPETAAEMRAHDFWVFSYLCNGINPKDIAELKYKDLDRSTQKITFRRAKTMRTNRGSKPIQVFLEPLAEEILNRYATQPAQPESFIFPILSPDDDLKKQDTDISLFTRSINKGMKAVCKKLGIDSTVSTIVARHSAATQLKRKGASMAYISESLGHQNQRTTESYMGSFEDDEKRKYGKALLDFEAHDEE